jgi:hypothetical protein
MRPSDGPPLDPVTPRRHGASDVLITPARLHAEHAAGTSDDPERVERATGLTERQQLRAVKERRPAAADRAVGKPRPGLRLHDRRGWAAAPCP